MMAKLPLNNSSGGPSVIWTRAALFGRWKFLSTIRRHHLSGR